MCALQEFAQPLYKAPRQLSNTVIAR